MSGEIREQPDRTAAALRGVLGQAETLARLLESADFVIVLGRGSSRSAATFATEVLRTLAGKPAFSVSPAQLGYGATALGLRRALVVAISQSGESLEVLTAARRALADGAQLLVVTNSASSTLAGLVPPEQVLLCHAGVELAVPATKSFTTSLACLYGLAVAASPDALADAAESLPARMHRMITEEAARFDAVGAREYILVGEGYAEAVAEEGAIKLRETLRINATSFEASELLHGSINSAGPGTMVIAIAADSLGAQLAEQVISQARQRGARTVSIGGLTAATAESQIPLPDVRPEWAPFLAVIPIQMAAHAACLASGQDPDLPPGLTKITRIANLEPLSS
jgi:glutamine---fructose-6-phosphate transaminase (isomerizing)